MKRSGNTVTLNKGESFAYEVAVTDSDGLPATDIAQAQFCARLTSWTPPKDYPLQSVVPTLEKDCTVDDDLVSVELTEADTLQMFGTYAVVIRAKSSNGRVEDIFIGELRVKVGPIAVAV